MMSPGKIAQPPQAIGSFQPTKVSPLTEAGAATPAHQIGSFEASTPALSRITPSVTSAATLRFIIRMVRMSPKMPAVVTPMASATAMQPSGMASIAPRVEIGLRPAFRRREILAHRDEAHGEGRPDDAPAASLRAASAPASSSGGCPS